MNEQDEIHEEPLDNNSEEVQKVGENSHLEEEHIVEGDSHQSEDISSHHSPIDEPKVDANKIYGDDNEVPLAMAYDPKEKRKISGNKSSWARFIAGFTIVSLVGGGAIGSSFALVSAYAKKHINSAGSMGINSAQAPLMSGNVQPVVVNNTITDIANNVGPSVVSIYNTKVVSTIYGDYGASGIGSGVIFNEDDEKIYIVTNSHVVNGATSLAVNFLGNAKVACDLIGEDTTSDIAVVSVDKKNIDADTLASINPARFGDSDSIQVGEVAVAIGTPMEAAFNNTVTAGVISATNRQVQIDTSRTMTLIQTDAAINPGNSGGALVGPTGEVIGINTVKLVDSSIEGMGFAIPINTVKPIIEDIMVNGTIVRPGLGILGQDISSAAAELYELPIGVLITEVIQGGSADMAGIQAQDILFEFDGTKITSMNQLKSLLNNKRVGDQVEVKIIRNNEKKVINMTLREMPQTYN